MSWFNYPPDPDPQPVTYFREHKLTAQKIDAGVALAVRKTDEEICKENSDAAGVHISDTFGVARNCTIRQLSTPATEQSNNSRSAVDIVASQIFGGR